MEITETKLAQRQESRRRALGNLTILFSLKRTIFLGTLSEQEDDSAPQAKYLLLTVNTLMTTRKNVIHSIVYPAAEPALSLCIKAKAN